MIPPIYIYKSNDSWWYNCRVPMCGNSDCGPGHPKVVTIALDHLKRHGKLGFGKGR